MTPLPRRQKVFNHVNYQAKIAGFAEPFLLKDMSFDSHPDILRIKAPGATPFYDSDYDIRVEILDLDVPAIMRQGLANGGWLEMSMSEFVGVLRLMCSVDD
jgi:hypothetical protein